MIDHPIGHSPVEDLDIDAAGRHTADGDLVEEAGGGGVAGAVHARAVLTTRAVPGSAPAAASSIAAWGTPSVFGPGAVLTARLPLSEAGANTGDPHLCDAYTGPIMAIADQTPV